MNVVQNSQKFRVREYPGKYTPSGEEFDLKRRISSNLHGTFYSANVPEAICSCVGIIDDHHRGEKS